MNRNERRQFERLGGINQVMKEALYHRKKFIEMMNLMIASGHEAEFTSVQLEDPMFKEGLTMGVSSYTILTNQTLKGEFGFGPKRLSKFEEALSALAKSNMEREAAGEDSADIMPGLKG